MKLSLRSPPNQKRRPLGVPIFRRIWNESNKQRDVDWPSAEIRCGRTAVRLNMHVVPRTAITHFEFHITWLWHSRKSTTSLVSYALLFSSCTGRTDKKGEQVKAVTQPIKHIEKSTLTKKILL